MNEIITDVKGLKERLSRERHGDKNRIFLSQFGLLNPEAGTDLPYYKNNTGKHLAHTANVTIDYSS